MPPDIVLPRPVRSYWTSAFARLALAVAGLMALTVPEWGEMFHQWWEIDTYAHILLIPPIIAWFAWLRRGELAQIEPQGWWPGLVWTVLGLLLWISGRTLEINLFAQAGAVAALQGTIVAILGLRAGLILAFPVAYMAFLVPFGDEIIPPLQTITAALATALTRLSGVDMVSNGIHIDTPAGLFVIAEACSGVKFLIAMVALGVLVAHSCFASWHRRAWLMLACLVVPILANGIRAWATIFVAQYVGAEVAGGFDHIVYGWFFFAIVIAAVLGLAWRWFERIPEDAGWSVAELDANPLVQAWAEKALPGNLVLGAVLVIALLFAGLARLG